MRFTDAQAEPLAEVVSNATTVQPALQLVATKSSAAGVVEVLQGANMTLSSVLQVEADEAMNLWMVELDSPTYFELNLSLANGLTFAKPLPVHCINAELVSRANPVEQVINEDVSVFSTFFLPQTRRILRGVRNLVSSKSQSAPLRLHLHASITTLRKCLDSLEVHIPWDTPVTVPWQVLAGFARFMANACAGLTQRS